MNTSASRILLVLTVGGLIGLSCEKPATPNVAPAITSFNLPDTVRAWSEETLSCTASDPDSDEISYNWTCSAGSLRSSTRATAVWFAPFSSGSATITLTVRDDSGASNTKNGTVVVLPVTTTLIDWSGLVEAGDYRQWATGYIYAGYTVSGSFSVDAHDITFMMMTTANYEVWRLGYPSYRALIEVDSSMGSNFSVVVPKTDKYSFILDNTHHAHTDSSAHLFVQLTTP
jgi:hypothetical protein